MNKSPLLLLLGAAAFAQSLPLGTVSHVQKLAACPAGYGGAASCWQATVSCPKTEDISVTYSYDPAPGTPKGTIFFHWGGPGTRPAGPKYTLLFSSAGFSLITMAWESAWEDTGLPEKNLKAAGCRPATLMKYVMENVAGGAAKCAVGFSGGSAAIAYALAEYGAGDYLDDAELISGPVFSDVAQGCKVPQPPPLTICASGQFGCSGKAFQDSPAYFAGYTWGMGRMTGDTTCGRDKPTTASSEARWKAMSIVDGLPDSTFTYPKTAIGGWVCNNGVNNSAAQGQLFYEQITSASQTAGFSLNPVNDCYSAEGVDAGTVANGQNTLAAFTSHVIASCVSRH
jgi:hypothetical protein